MKLRDVISGLLLLAGATGAAETPAFDRCVETQQQAIVDLLAAMKDARNVINRQPGQNPPGQQNPFRSKQRYELPMLNKDGNPEAQLDRLREKQEELLREMQGRDSGRKDSAGNGNLSARQAEIAGKLEKMATDGKPNSPLQRHLQDAAAAGRTAEKALHSNENSTARNAAMKALAEIKKSLGEINERSDRETAAAAGDIRRELNRAQRELANGRREQAAVAMEHAAAKAGDVTRRQLGSGRYANAEIMNGIARSIGRSQTELFKIDLRRAAEGLERLKKEITATTRNVDPAQGMLENVRCLQELVGESKYLQREKGGVTAAEAAKIWEDMELAAQSITGYAAELSGRKLPAAAELEQLAGKMADAVTGRNLAAAIPPAEKLIRDANAFLSGLTADRRLHLFNKEEAPAEYRRAVDKYFERLSETANGTSKKR